MTHYTQLSIQDRHQFAALLGMGLSIDDIATRLGRHRSTLYREVNRNSTTSGYYAGTASSKAHARRQRLSTIERNHTLRSYIVTHLKEGWSPEQIAGRLKRKKSKYEVCHETIYRFIYKNTHKKYFQYLPCQKKKRYRKRATRKITCRFGESRIITNRPEKAAQRKYSGHWEGDTIAFSGTKKKTVTTLVERKSRYLVLIKNDNKLSKDVMMGIAEKLTMLDKLICHTITFDQGAEFGNYALLERLAQCKVFYCHAHAPWERGSNENSNGRVRRYLPLATNIDNLSQNEIEIIANRMNNTPRKCLDYYTPKELFLTQYYEIRRTWV